MNTTQDAFMGARYWPQLDGLRTISILLVITSHMADPRVWGFINGSMGVTLFFVISGFLITSLLIREEQRRGKVSIAQFYIRRAFRILPLYYVALSTACFAVYVFGLGAGNSNFAERLPLIATFNGEFAGSGTFVHSWSLGIEEKFYLVWPILMFAIPFFKAHRLAVATTLLVLAGIASTVDGFRYFGIYTAILAGCVLALLMHTDRGFRAVSRLATPRAATALLVVAAVAYALDPRLPGATETGHAHVLFALATTLAFPGIILASTRLHAALAWKPLAYIGTRTYGMYLFHPFCIDVLNYAIPADQTNVAVASVRLVLAFALSLATAEVLYRLIEAPMIKVGRKLTGKAPRHQTSAKTPALT